MPDKIAVFRMNVRFDVTFLRKTAIFGGRVVLATRRSTTAYLPSRRSES
jgi:hypothetical protein